jgi:hypothetical protein
VITGPFASVRELADGEEVKAGAAAAQRDDTEVNQIFESIGLSPSRRSGPTSSDRC